MPSVKSIDDIKSSLLRPSLTSHFYVEFALPGTGGSTSEFSEKLKTAGIDFNVNKQDTLNLLCAEASLPGSSLATLEINNDRTGVTERHAHRRFFDDRIDFTFYVDVENYLPILFFETWMEYISGAGTTDDNPRSAKEYVYRMNYADNYTADKGLKVLKFEKDYGRGKAIGESNPTWRPTSQYLEYEFFRSFPIAINSMPVSYEAANLLKCTVSMNYIRYTVQRSGSGQVSTSPPAASPVQKVSQQTIQNADVYGGTAGPNTVFAVRDSATGARLDGGTDGPLLTSRQALGLDPIGTGPT